ncbi:unnamed protein product [Rotaria socialis]|uniref:Lipase maturation factor n=2 Tax=Rotaria TaxID=231623 RepID=A0A817SQV6_9BILA|nr:unnamed protein product [Rotaria socialis]CAF4405287.1 unnamed protein product [Rotaria socialis]
MVHMLTNDNKIRFEMKNHLIIAAGQISIFMELTRRKSQTNKLNENDPTPLINTSMPNEKRKNSKDVTPTEKNNILSYFQKIFLDQISSNTYFHTRILFVRLLGLVYTFSFLAAYHQAPVLIGYQGLYQSHIHMKQMKERYGIWQSPSMFYFLPWMDTSDISLRTICAAGTLLGIFLLFTGRCNSIILFILWCFQTSILNIGQLFYGFGWETQILETTFLGMFLVPLYSLSKIDRHSPPSILFIFLMRFLIARIMLGAGLIKIRGDQCWRDLTCMQYHYETQPIPNAISYYLHQTPASFHKFEVLVNHFIELIAPFLCFGPRRSIRHIGGTLQILFQILLIISGNLSVLNWVTIAPALWCFDDTYPLYKYIFKRQTYTEIIYCGIRRRIKVLNSIIKLFVFSLIIFLSIDPVLNLFSRYQRMNSSFDRFNLVNTYGAFGSVGKIRNEVIITGCNKSTVEQCSHDNAWLEYEFSCKPGKIDKTPCFSAPYHRRLTWQLWFAAMQNLQYNPWLIHLMVHLLASDQYSPVNVVLSVGGNPFPDAPPRFIKADLYRYKFASLGSGDKNWWTRTYQQSYAPIFELKSPQLKSILRQMTWKMPKVPMRS